VTTEPNLSVTPPEPAPPARSMPLSPGLTYPDEYRDGKSLPGVRQAVPLAGTAIGAIDRGLMLLYGPAAKPESTG
jgi:hypothetical protein